MRTWPGRTPPTPDAVLAEDSARTLVRFDATIRDGALAVAAPREDATFPADVDVDHVAIRPIALRFGVGAVLGVSPARVDGRRALLRLGFHAARLLGERRISGEDVDRDAPLLASISFAGEVPAADGVASSVVADSGDPETSFVLAWRVSLAREPARTAGALAYSLHADRPLVQRIAPPRGGPIELPEETIDLEEFDEWRAPAPVPPGLRAAIVEPGWCVLTGDDAALRAYADGAEASRAARLAPATFRSGRTRLPLVPSRGAVLVQGRVVPFAEIAEIDIAQESAGAAFRTGWSFHGRTLEILPAGGDGDGGGGDDGGGVLARVRNSPPPEIERGAARLPRSDSDGERTSRDVLDRLRLREDATQVVLRPGDASTASGLSLETATW